MLIYKEYAIRRQPIPNRLNAIFGYKKALTMLHKGFNPSPSRVIESILVKPLPEVKREPVTYRLPNRILTAIREESKRSGHTQNNVVEFWLSDHIAELQKPRFTPYKIIDSAKVVLYDRQESELVIVYLAEDIDEQIHLECERHVGSAKCDHIDFVKQIPSVKARIKEAMEESKT